MSPAGIDPAWLFSNFDFASRRTVLAAVSGGSDSIALLFLVKDHLQRLAPGTRLVAATVDHRLRRESAAEAEIVARLCADLNIKHRILAWTGQKPAAGLPAAAREARYRLLGQTAEDIGADIILTGHTADDQAETVLMRHARKRDRHVTGSLRGLAGMAQATLYNGKVWIVRPLLGMRRQALRAYLTGRGIGWADDPSNADPAYERPRVRAHLAQDADDRIAAALQAASDAAGNRTALGQTAAALIRAHATMPAPGLVRLDPSFAQAEPQDAAVYALRMLLAVLGGKPFLPDETRSSALSARLAKPGTRAVLSRTLVDCRKNGIFLLREARGLPSLPSSLGMAWDGRYVVGARGAASRKTPAVDDDIPPALVRVALAGQPAATDYTPILAPWAQFLPSFDLAPARAVAALIGRPEIPQPPFREHIAEGA